MNRFRVCFIIEVLLIVSLILLKPSNMDYLVQNRGITCWKCSHEIKGENCDNCGADVMEDGLLTNRDYICRNCGRQLFWTYSGKCYYCSEPQNHEYEKFSSRFDSYADYKKQLDFLFPFSVGAICIITVYIVFVVICIVRWKKDVKNSVSSSNTSRRGISDSNKQKNR